MNDTKIQMPKAAQQFIDDAKAAGFTVKVTHDSVAIDVWVEDGKTNGAATWRAGTFYSEPLSGERLGFRTSGGRPGVRFEYGSSHTPYAGHKTHRSLRQVRGAIGLPI
jgi:hypothetical protein